MTATFKQLTDFFVEMDAEQVEHTDKSYLAHAIGVYKDLQAWGCDEDVCRAGMFHSVYGTERFQGFTLPLSRREELRQLIGHRAERLAYVNCAMDRGSFDANLDHQGPYSILDRFTNQQVALSNDEFHDLCQVHLCDWLEQVPRSREWDYRRESYRKLADRLGGKPRESHGKVYAT